MGWLLILFLVGGTAYGTSRLQDSASSEVGMWIILMIGSGVLIGGILGWMFDITGIMNFSYEIWRSVAGVESMRDYVPSCARPHILASLLGLVLVLANACFAFGGMLALLVSLPAALVSGIRTGFACFLAGIGCAIVFGLGIRLVNLVSGGC